jgi:hypothetical protein
MTKRDRETLIERVTSAWRARDPDGSVRSHPAWHDLDGTGREQAYELTCRLRAMEACLDRDGLSSTARAVLFRISTARVSPRA